MSKLNAQITKLQTARAAAVATIEGIDAKLPELIAQRDAEVAAEQARAAVEANGVPVGTAITFDYGRAATRTERTGKVLAFRAKTDTVPAAYKVETGEGFDLEVVTVLAANVKGVVAAEQAAS